MSDTVTTHQRPGVYSSYSVSSAVRGTTGRKTVGLVAVNDTATALEAVTVTSYSQGLSTFGSGTMTDLITAVLEHGAASVVAVPIGESEDGEDSDAVCEAYEAGLAVLENLDDIDILICDSVDIDVQTAFRDSAVAASDNRRERICVLSCGSGESVTAMIARAAALNSERVVLTAPGDIGVAAAVAGVIAEELDPAVPLGGGELTSVDVTTQYSENDLDLLILGGVTPVEYRSGVTSVVRGITSRTTTSGVSDTTWRDLSTVLIVDNVIPAIRDSLTTKFKRAKNTEQSRGAIRSQVVLELETKLSAEIISSYDGVTVEVDETDPTICVVGFSFGVANTLNQIWITAYVTV